MVVLCVIKCFKHNFLLFVSSRIKFYISETNKRKGLPQWLRDALNKKEKEKQKKSERERAKQPSSDVSDEEETVSKSNVEQNQPSIRNVEKVNFYPSFYLSVSLSCYPSIY